jgi:hypothetical protein
MRKPLEQQTFAKLGLYRKNPYLKQGVSHLKIRYIFLLLTALTASGVVMYLMMLPTDYIMPHGKITGKDELKRLWKSDHGLIKTLSWHLPRGINEKQTEHQNSWCHCLWPFRPQLSKVNKI